MEYIIHCANVLYLISYLVKDILWLRIITIIAIILLIPYFYAQSEPLYAAIVWNVVFAIINSYQVYLLFVERRPVFLNEKEEELRQLAFNSLSTKEFKKILEIGQWDNVESDTRIIKEGQKPENLMVLIDGKAKVEKGTQLIADIKPGQFLGEMSYMTGENTMADVTTQTKSKIFKLPCEELNKLLDKLPQVRASIQDLIGRDLVTKLAS